MKPILAPLQNLKSIESKAQTHRQNNFKIYEHLQSFNTVDIDETMDIDEKFKAKKKHMVIMNKLEARPEGMKVKKYLDFERLNLKSHLYNETIKTEKMFLQLNAGPKPKLDETQLGNESSQQQ
jgi:hypothetical protein